jgi:hypothetical protein
MFSLPSLVKLESGHDLYFVGATNPQNVNEKRRKKYMKIIYNNTMYYLNNPDKIHFKLNFGV